MKRCGLLGEKLGHSYSPAIHAELADYEYRLYEVAPEKLGEFLTGGGFDGSKMHLIVPEKIGQVRMETIPVEALRDWMQDGGIR